MKVEMKTKMRLVLTLLPLSLLFLLPSCLLSAYEDYGTSPSHFIETPGSTYVVLVEDPPPVFKDGLVEASKAYTLYTLYYDGVPIPYIKPWEVIRIASSKYTTIKVGQLETIRVLKRGK